MPSTHPLHGAMILEVKQEEAATNGVEKGEEAASKMETKKRGHPAKVK